LNIKNLLLTIVLVLLWNIAPVLAQQVPTYYLPYQIYNTKTQQWISMENLLASLTQNEVVFIGEQHNDNYGHKFKLAILQGLQRRQSNVTIAMEMFERDVQTALDDYLQSKITEKEFLSRSRPWSNYLSDYRPLVEYARSQRWRVVGSNAPQRLARAVAQNGQEIVPRFFAEDRSLVAQQLEYPHDDYWQRFIGTMLGGAGHGAESNPNPHAFAGSNGVPPAVERFYQAQVLKDETMAESIVSLLQPERAQKRLFVHFNGDFHSAFGGGAMQRVRRRMPDVRLQNVSIIPVDNLDKIDVAEYLQQADYLVFTPQQ
jgi:uncharacterized iron-regulated protein